jgi:hypothetical protein
MSDDRNPKLTYEIRVQGELDQSWTPYFNDLRITPTFSNKSPVTTLIAPVIDQPALRGLLCKLWDLNLTLISVRQLEAGYSKENRNE